MDDDLVLVYDRNAVLSVYGPLMLAVSEHPAKIPKVADDTMSAASSAAHLACRPWGCERQPIRQRSGLPIAASGVSSSLRYVVYLIQSVPHARIGKCRPWRLPPNPMERHCIATLSTPSPTN